MSVQENWPISLKTPLGDDVLVADAYQASEGVSRLFGIRLDAISEKPGQVIFDQILGQSVTLQLKLPGGTGRYWNGIVNRIAQSDRTPDYTIYQLEVVPKFWLLTRVARSRIFQQKGIPDILKEVLTGLDVSYQLVGAFEKRDYCVQYRETDFHFASRLMEEEGIFYFFKHTDGGHQMVVANSPACHPDLPADAKLRYDEIRGGVRKKDRIVHWDKSQEIRSGKFTLWDHCFELPHKHLEADQTAQESVAIGSQSMKLKLSFSDELEQYDYPGGYAHRFDGVGPGGEIRSSDTQKIFTDNKRTVGIRMQEETAGSLIFHAQSDCRQLVAGHKFELEDHFSDDSKYVVLAAEHSASHPLGSERNQESFEYSNKFTCLPHAIPFRPSRITPLPAVRGAQTAVVVGPAGEEIFPDKYGRVKVQFHWDRDGKSDPNSSCWLRVATAWAGKQWGMIHIPRVGQEVLVDFLEGDPDRPIIVGSVYNADQMPPYNLPANKTQSGIKTRSSKGGGADNFNEIRFEDNKGKEQIVVHAEKDLITEVENDEQRKVGNDRTTVIANNEAKTVQRGNESVKIELGKQETEAMQSIELKVGQSSVKLDQMGVTIKGMTIKIEGQIQVEVKGMITQVNGDAMLIAKGGIVMIN